MPGDVTSTKVGTDGSDPAADIESHGIWDNDLFGSQNGSNGYAESRMNVGHQGNMAVNKGQFSQAYRLLKRPILDVIYALEPNFQRDSLVFLIKESDHLRWPGFAFYEFVVQWNIFGKYNELEVAIQEKNPRT